MVTAPKAQSKPAIRTSSDGTDPHRGSADKPHPLMRTSEVADLFRVNPTTVIRWAEEGKLSCSRTLGGQRRYLRAEIEALVAADGQDEER
jgi:excisionase family DNA binding protein